MTRTTTKPAEARTKSEPVITTQQAALVLQEEQRKRFEVFQVEPVP